VDPSEHLAAAETVGKCIVLASPAGGAVEDVNKAVAEYVNKYKDKMVGFAFVDPAEDGISSNRLSALRDKEGFDGLVLYCTCSGVHPAHSRAMRFYEAAQELKLPVFFHNGGAMSPQAVMDYAQPYLLDEVARVFGELKIVIGSMGVPFVDQTLSMAAKHENVYADLTISPANVWQVYNTVVAANEWGVMDKLLFGSGFPFGNAGQCIETLLGFNKLLGDTDLPTVPRAVIQEVIERNSLEVLGIDRGS